MDSIMEKKNHDTRFTTPAKVVVPSKTGVAAALAATTSTPGGFQLFDFINGFQESPFVTKQAASSTTPCMHTPRSHHSSKQTNSKSPSQARTPRHRIEWHECQLDAERPFYHLIDWSIKYQIELQCQPASAIPVPYDARAQQQAMRLFSSDDIFSAALEKCDTKTRPTDVSEHVEWHKAMYVWQHPAIYPLQRPDLRKVSMSDGNQMPHLRVRVETTPSVAKEATGGKSSKPSTTFGNLTDSFPSPSHKRPRALHNATKVDANVQSSPHDFWSIRCKEWQEAFRSIYLNWIDVIRILDEHRLQNDKRINDGDFVKLVSDSYFYAIGKEQTILFRVGLGGANINFDTNGVATRKSLVPEIVVSASTFAQRKALYTMGIQYKPLDRSQKVTTTNGFEGVDHGHTKSHSVRGSDDHEPSGADDASPNIKAELVALRRAQTVGADVTVFMRPKVNKTNTSREQVFPIFISDMDDCAAFFELYMNSFGVIGTDRATRLVKKARENDRDVPLLLCRKLGPFVHATVKHAQGSKRNCPNDTSGGIFITGYILPCAVREMVCASVHLMQENVRHNCVEGGGSESDAGDCEDVGSHHLLVRAATVADGESNRLVQGQKASGSSRSEALNGPWSVFQSQAFVHTETQHCHVGESLALAVWDITRPTTLAFKLDIEYGAR